MRRVFPDSGWERVARIARTFTYCRLMICRSPSGTLTFYSVHVPFSLCTIATAQNENEEPLCGRHHHCFLHHTEFLRRFITLHCARGDILRTNLFNARINHHYNVILAPSRPCSFPMCWVLRFKFCQKTVATPLLRFAVDTSLRPRSSAKFTLFNSKAKFSNQHFHHQKMKIFKKVLISKKVVSEICSNLQS